MENDRERRKKEKKILERKYDRTEKKKGGWMTILRQIEAFFFKKPCLKQWRNVDLTQDPNPEELRDDYCNLIATSYFTYPGSVEDPSQQLCQTRIDTRMIVVMRMAIEDN